MTILERIKRWFGYGKLTTHAPMEISSDLKRLKEKIRKLSKSDIERAVKLAKAKNSVKRSTVPVRQTIELVDSGAEDCIINDMLAYSTMQEIAEAIDATSFYPAIYNPPVNDLAYTGAEGVIDALTNDYPEVTPSVTETPIAIKESDLAPQQAEASYEPTSSYSSPESSYEPTASYDSSSSYSSSDSSSSYDSSSYDSGSSYDSSSSYDSGSSFDSGSGGDF